MKYPRIQKILKYLIIGGFLATIFSFALLFPTNQASAGGVLSWFGSALADVTIGPFVTIIMILIPYGIGLVGGFMLKMVAYVVSLLFSMNVEILPDKNGIIELGYKISLSLANVIFVIALIGIAFATMFNVQEYSAKKKLGQLIVTAILVNFGLLICGFLLDLSHVITNFFLTGGKVGDGLAAALGPSRFMISPIDPSNLTAGLAMFQAQWWTLVAGNAMLAIFTWVMVVVMAAVGGMFLWRYIKLVGLIIVLPFVWAVDLIPGAGGKKGEWWHEFLQAVFFLPGAGFFIYLAINMAAKISTPANLAASQNADLFHQLPQLVLQLVVVIGILQYGMTLAQKMGGEIAKKGIALSRKATDPLMRGVGKATKGIYGGALSYRPKGKVGQFITGGGLLQAIPGAGKFTKGKSVKDIAGGIAQGTGKGLVDKIKASKGINEFDTAVLGSALKETGRGIERGGVGYEAESKKLEEMGHERYHDLLENPPKDPRELAALTKFAAKEGDIDQLIEHSRKSIEELANNYTNLTPSAREKREKDDTLKALAGQDPIQSKKIVGQDKSEFISKLSNDELRKYLNIKKYTDYEDDLTDAQKGGLGRKNGEYDRVVNRGESAGLANLLQASSDQGLRNAGDSISKTLEKMYGPSGEEGVKKELVDLKKSLLVALNKKDTVGIGDISRKIDRAQEKFNLLAKEQRTTINLIKENPAAKSDPQITAKIESIDKISRMVGAGGVGDKAEKSQHAEKGGKSAFNSWFFEDHGGGGGGKAHP